MAGRRGPQPVEDLTPEQSKYVLDELLRDRRISKADLRVYMNRMKDEARQLMERLQSLGWTGAAVAGATVAAAAIASSPRARAAIKRAAQKVTPAVKAGRKLQGQYLGLIRQIPEAQRAQYSRMAKEDSREAAIKAMRAALGKDAGGSQRGAKKGRKRRARKAR